MMLFARVRGASGVTDLMINLRDVCELTNDGSSSSSSSFACVEREKEKEAASRLAGQQLKFKMSAN